MYRIEVDKEQARYIANAVEMYARMAGGQIELYHLHPLEKQMWKEKKHSYYQIINNLLTTIKNLIFPDLGTGGIVNNTESDIGYDIYKSILEQFEKDRMEKEGDNYIGNVHSPPFHPFSTKDKPKVEKITK